MVDKNNNIEKYQFIHHFVPHKHQKTRARLLTNEALIAYALIQILLIALIRIVPIFAPGILGYASNINTSDLLKYTNEQRARVGLKPLTLNQKLSVAADAKAKDMFKVGYWAHISPLGTKPWDFILSQKYDYVYAGENLAKNFYSSKDVVEAWYASPSHRDNMLSSNYDDIGFAIVNGIIDGYETTIVVQMFGRERVPVQVAVSDPVPPVEEEATEPASETELVPAQEELQPEPVESPIPVEDETITEPRLQPVEIAQSDTPNVSGEVTPILQQLTESENLIDQQDGTLIDIKTASRTITYAFGGFLMILLAIDMWYSHKHGILKITGHTFAHFLFLAIIIASVMLSIVPGSIL